MLTRNELLKLLEISNDDLKTRSRRLLVPFDTENRPRNEYSPTEALAFLLIDELASEGRHPADGPHLSRAAAASAVRASLIAIGKALPAIMETGEALVRGISSDEILVEIIWLSGLSGRVAFAGTLEEISKERGRLPAFPVHGVLMNATRAFAKLGGRASRAGIQIDWAD
jgi:hypothetical protein